MRYIRRYLAFGLVAYCVFGLTELCIAQQRWWYLEPTFRSRGPDW